MEIIFIALLGGILFLEHGTAIRQKILAAASRDSRGLIKYLGSAAVLMLTLTCWPSLLLMIYMRQHGFFAFEVFDSAYQGFQIVSLNVFANFLVLSFYLAAFYIIPRFTQSRPWRWAGGALSILIGSVLLAFGVTHGQYALLAGVLVLCGVIGGYLCFWVRPWGDKARYWWIPMALAGVLLAGPMIPGFGWIAATALTGNALAQMKVGNMDIELSEPLGFADPQPAKLLKARLILRTPEFYYLKVKTDNLESILILSTEHVSSRYALQAK